MSRRPPGLLPDSNLLTGPAGPLDPARWRAEVLVFFSAATGRTYLVGDDPAAPWILRENLVTRGNSWPPEGESDLSPLCAVPARVDAPERLGTLVANTAVLPRSWGQLGVWHAAVQADHQFRKRLVPPPRGVLSLSAWARPILDAAAGRRITELAESLGQDGDPEDASPPDPEAD